MIFRQWTAGAVMEQNHYGIPEPAGTAEILLPDIDLILLPLVGWDDSGGRLGMGAGFYDRALQPFRQSPSPVRMGVAYQMQKLPLIPTEPWDIRLHMILSEIRLGDLSRRLKTCRKNMTHPAGCRVQYAKKEHHSHELLADQKRTRCLQHR